MSIEGIFPIGDGMLDVDEQLLKGLLVPHDINDIYDVEQTPFARGKFAAVRRAIHKNSGVHFAAKFLKRRRRAQSSDKEIKHEIAVLMLCDGAENIVKLNAVHESRSDTALLLELATGGELQTFLDNEECLSETQARYCMREVLKGLEYLHERSIAHLDLKPQNILLTGENIEDGLKLCDFGISRVVAEGSNVREIVGTPDYVAPEVLQYEPLSLLTDIWSVGVLAYVLLTGFSPFGGDTKQETFLNISQCALEFPDKLFGGVSAAAIDFIRRALRIKPNDRMTAAGCLEHIWLKDECAIGRQVYNKLAQIATDSEDEEEEDDDEDDENVVDVDDDVENKILDDKLVENLENIVKQVNDDIDIVKNGSNVQNMESSDTEVESLPINNTTNGRAHKYQNGTSSIVAASTTNSKQTNGIMTTTTTAVHTVPAARATTIPLCTHIHQKHYQQQQQQQQIQNLIAGRRHSSDANKENTFLATKKIVPTTNNGGKKSNGLVMLQQTTTATIIIGASNASLSDEIDDDGNYEVDADEEEVAEEEEDDEAENAQLVCNGNSNCINGSSLFPDAPTTPKVIRKAPTTDTSPTSVKALVKKFQLEGGNQQNTLNNSTITTTAVAAAVLTPTPVSTTNTTTTIVLPTSGKSASTLKQQQQNSSRKSTTTLIVNGYKNNGATTLNTNGCLRRFSEPHVNGKTTTKLTSTSSMTASKPPSPASYKSTCVYCLTCGATSNNTSNGQRSADSPTKSTTNGCRHSTVTAVTTSSPTKTSSIPLYQHHHNHHQHNHNHNHSIHHHAHALHHHHELLVVAKNGGATSATSNLSVDQGIIC